jgi:DNA mismatch repair protein MutS
VPVTSGQKTIRVQQLALFGGTHPVVDELRALDVNVLSPLEALNKLFELKKRAQ